MAKEKGSFGKKHENIFWKKMAVEMMVIGVKICFGMIGDIFFDQHCFMMIGVLLSYRYPWFVWGTDGHGFATMNFFGDMAR